MHHTLVRDAPRNYHSIVRLLTIDRNVLLVSFVALDKFSALDEHAARAAARIYKDAVFDTNVKDSLRHISAQNIKKSRAFTVLTGSSGRAVKALDALCSCHCAYAMPGKLTPLCNADRQIIKMWSNN